MLRANRSSWSGLGRSESSARGGDHPRSSQCRTLGEDNRLPTHARVRAFLENGAKRRIPITYQELAKALQILPPHSIQQVTEALERLMEEDAAADRPFIAALVISKARGGLPARGFFDCARRLGGSRAIRTVRTQGRFTPASWTPSSLAGAVRATTKNKDIMFTETNPTPNRGRQAVQTPADHNGLNQCPAAAI